MTNPTGEAQDGIRRPDFDRRVMVQFRGSVVTSDAGLLAYRELDDALGLSSSAGDRLADTRTGKNGRHALIGMLRQSVFGRLAGYEDVNDAERLRHDPAMRWIIGGKAVKGCGASPSQMGRFETNWLARSTKFPATTSLPRPTQIPRPPFWVAALATDTSFENAGRLGHSVMAIPLAATSQMRRLIGIYRTAWRAAGHAGEGTVMLAFHMFCDRDDDNALQTARAPLMGYLNALVEAASDWTSGSSSKDYPGYDKIIEKLRNDTIETQVASGAAWVGSPQTITKQIEEYLAEIGPFEMASLQVNFGDMPYEVARTSMRLFANEVMPTFLDRSVVTHRG